MPLEKYRLQLGIPVAHCSGIRPFTSRLPYYAPGGSFQLQVNTGILRVCRQPKAFSSESQRLMIYNEELYEINIYPDLAGFADAPGSVSASI
jgi:hypothetical protein